MTLYMIRGETVTAHSSAPATISEGELLVGSAEQIEASGLANARLTAIWNALPGVNPITKFKDRKTAAQRLWAAFGQLPVEAEPASGSPGPRAGSKQAQVVAMLERPEGATVDEVMAETGWQPHTVRGVMSGALKKKLGLTILSEKEQRGRVYRIAARPAA